MKNIKVIYYFYPEVRITSLEIFSRYKNILLEYVDRYRIKKKDKEEEVEGILIYYGLPIKKEDLKILNKIKYKTKMLKFYNKLLLNPQEYERFFNLLLYPRGEYCELEENVNKDAVDSSILMLIRSIYNNVKEANKYYSLSLQKTTVKDVIASIFYEMQKNPRALINTIVIIFVIVMMFFMFTYINNSLRSVSTQLNLIQQNQNITNSSLVNLIK